MPRGRMESTAGADPLLAGQTSIDDVLEEQYDLTPQLPNSPSIGPHLSQASVFTPPETLDEPRPLLRPRKPGTTTLEVALPAVLLEADDHPEIIAGRVPRGRPRKRHQNNSTGPPKVRSCCAFGSAPYRLGPRRPCSGLALGPRRAAVRCASSAACSSAAGCFCFAAANQFE
jgi:hypothetical protein